MKRGPESESLEIPGEGSVFFVSINLEKVLIREPGVKDLVFKINAETNQQLAYHVKKTDGLNIFIDDDCGDKSLECPNWFILLSDVEQERVMKIGTDHPEGAAALLQNDQGINYLDAEDFVSWFSNRKKTSSLVGDGDLLSIRVLGSGLLKIFLLLPESKVCICQKGFAIVTDEFAEQFQETFLNTVKKQTVYCPEIVFDVTKINKYAKRQLRSLVCSSSGLKNFRDSGVLSSITEWRDINACIDKGDVVHFSLSDGYVRMYETKLHDFLAVCCHQYHKKTVASQNRLKCYRIV